MKQYQERLQGVLQEIKKVISGKEEVIQKVMTAIFQRLCC